VSYVTFPGDGVNAPLREGREPLAFMRLFSGRRATPAPAGPSTHAGLTTMEPALRAEKSRIGSI
jgi:hypothetical protein